jgi:hypothetical protein
MLDWRRKVSRGVAVVGDCIVSEDGQRISNVILWEHPKSLKLPSDFQSEATQTKPACAGLMSVHAGGLGLCSREFYSPDLCEKLGCSRFYSIFRMYFS